MHLSEKIRGVNMIKIKDKSMCSGCHACANICPVQCISMIYDEEGFLYPDVDFNKCINCGACKKVCHTLNNVTCDNLPKVYACYNLDEEVRLSSSSGGMFALFAEHILDLGGVVFGAAFDENLEVKHFSVESKENLYKFRSSKYMQSVIGDSYINAKKILETGRPVLFTGTPCQIRGLHLYLGKEYDSLYTQDMICHGVTSAKVWKKYLNYLEKINNTEVDTSFLPSFRFKTYGWLNYSVNIHFKNNKIYNQKHRNDPFVKLYLSNLLLRFSCYKCNCRGVNRVSDITLADFWGVDKLMSDMFDNKGTSLVFLNSEKARKLFDAVKTKCVFKETTVDVATKYNSSMYISPIRPLKRKALSKKFANSDFEVLYSKTTQITIFEKIYNRLVRFLNSK